MDVCKSEKALGKHSPIADRTRPPLVSADNKNGTTRRSRTREISSRYRSPAPSSPGGSNGSPSPNASRMSSTSSLSLPKRAVSAERRRPSTPSSPPSLSLSTPAHDTSAEVLLTPRKTNLSNKLPESLWPSTMRSLSISFQSETFAVAVGKKEKTVSHMQMDRSLRPSLNVARKGEKPLSGKGTPERKRSPLKGKNSSDQLENSKPVDSLHARLVDQHRWPSRTSGKTSTSLNRSDSTDKVNKPPSLSHSKIATPSTRRLSLDGISKPLQKSSSDIVMLMSRAESGKEISCRSSVDDGLLKRQRPSSSSSSERTSLVNAAARTQSLTALGSRPPSPSVSSGISPRARLVTPSSRGNSPARARPSSPSRQPQNSTSVLSFIPDIRIGKRIASNIEDVHQLRLMYNRHLQWRYANARTDAALKSQKTKAEKTLCNIWRIILDLSDSVMEKRSNLQQLSLKLKLYSVLVNQVMFLDDWASFERDHTNSLTWAIQDLQASTLRIPLTEGARGEIKSVKAAVCSAVDVMKAMGLSLCSILSKMEGMNCLVSELAELAAHESTMLNECESLFGSICALQVEEHSLRTHIILMKQAWRNNEPSIFGY